MNRGKRIGVLGGTFDPVHFGHLEIARAARAAFSLEVVLFVPTGFPYLRGGSEAPTEDRVAMVRRATAAEEGLEISLVDTERSGATYTVDTLEDLRRDLGDDAEIYFLLGGDALAELSRWHSPQRVKELCSLVCVGRPGGPRPQDLPEGHPGRDAIYMEGPLLDVSATEIRRRIARGEPVDGLVPEVVLQYIRERGLYQTDRNENGKDQIAGEQDERE